MATTNNVDRSSLASLSQNLSPNNNPSLVTNRNQFSQGTPNLGGALGNVDLGRLVPQFVREVAPTIEGLQRNTPIFLNNQLFGTVDRPFTVPVGSGLIRPTSERLLGAQSNLEAEQRMRQQHEAAQKVLGEQRLPQPQQDTTGLADIVQKVDPSVRQATSRQTVGGQPVTDFINRIQPIEMSPETIQGVFGDRGFEGFSSSVLELFESQENDRLKSLLNEVRTRLGSFAG